MTPDLTPPDDETRRMLEALERAALRACRVAAQTGTRVVTMQDGRIVAERVPYEEGAPPDPAE